MTLSIGTLSFIPLFSIPAGGGTFGTLTTGSASTTVNNSLIYCVGPFAAPSTGTVTKISIYSSNIDADADFELGIYNNNAGVPGTLVAAETDVANVGTWSAGWKEFTVSYSVTQGNYYWLCFQTNSAFPTIYYEDNLDANVGYWTTEHTFGDAWVNNPTEFNNATAEFCIKATIT